MYALLVVHSMYALCSHAGGLGGAGHCIQQCWVGLDHACSSVECGWTMHAGGLGVAGHCIQQWWVRLDHAYTCTHYLCSCTLIIIPQSSKSIHSTSYPALVLTKVERST